MNAAQAEAFIARQKEEEMKKRASLEAARISSSAQNKKTDSAGQVKSVAKEILSAGSLIKQIDPFMDWFFGIALMCAILKDVSDLLIIGALPVIGSLITFFASVIIFLSLVLTGARSKIKRKTSLLKNRYVLTVLGSLLEMLFGINFIPFQTITVILVFYFTLQQRQITEAEQQESSAQESYA